MQSRLSQCSTLANAVAEQTAESGRPAIFTASKTLRDRFETLTNLKSKLDEKLGNAADVESKMRQIAESVRIKCLEAGSKLNEIKPGECKDVTELRQNLELIQVSFQFDLVELTVDCYFCGNDCQFYAFLGHSIFNRIHRSRNRKKSGNPVVRRRDDFIASSRTGAIRIE